MTLFSPPDEPFLVSDAFVVLCEQLATDGWYATLAAFSRANRACRELALPALQREYDTFAGPDVTVIASTAFSMRRWPFARRISAFLDSAVPLEANLEILRVAFAGGRVEHIYLATGSVAGTSAVLDLFEIAPASLESLQLYLSNRAASAIKPTHRIPSAVRNISVTLCRTGDGDHQKLYHLLNAAEATIDEWGLDIDSLTIEDFDVLSHELVQKLHRLSIKCDLVPFFANVTNLAFSALL